MARVTENRNVGEAGSTGGAWTVVDRHVGAWLPIAWKLAVFYAVWIGFAMFARSQASTPELLQFTAIAYWFGWLFVAMTIALGAFIALTGWLDRARLRSNKRTKY